MNITILETLRRLAAEQPEKPILADAAHPAGLSAAEVWEMSGRVRALLKARGIGRENFVLIRLPRGVEPFAAMIGVWRAGAALIVLEEEYVPERVAFIRRDCGVKLEIDRAVWAETMKTPPLDGCEPVRPHDAAFVVYTSGTTGTPKGALHEYGQLNRIAASLSPREFACRNEGAFGYVAPLNFIVAQMFFGVWMGSGVLFHVMDPSVARNPTGFDAYLKRHGIDICFLTTSYVRQVGHLFRNLPNCIVGSESGDGLFLENTALFNAYGMSESAFVIALYAMSARTERTPVGKPRFDLALQLLDEDGMPVAPSESREVCFDNPYFRGYVGRPDETANALRGGLFHTGDLGRFDADGNLIICGRLNDMVKINGNRVEPGEIEGVARRVLGNENVACRIVSNGDAHLVCIYYVGETEVDVAQLRADMARYLPAYMLPAVCMRVEAFPKTRTGKLDRRALPTPNLRSDVAIVPPTTDFEKHAFSAVAAELGTNDFGVLTNLLALGLTSVRAIRLSVAIEKATGRCVRVSDMLAHPRLCDWEIFSAVAASPLAGLAGEEACPLTENQLGIYLDWTKSPQGLQYNIPFVVRFDATSYEALCAAVYKTIAAHPELTARLEDRAGDVVQVRRDGIDLPIALEKLEREPDIAFFQTKVRPFHLLKDDLARFAVYVTPTSTYLFADIHHIVFDGGSLNIFLRDVVACLRGGTPAVESASSFDYALYSRDWLASEAANDAERYFDGLIRGTESFFLAPAATAAVASGKSARLVKCLPAADVRAKCRELGVTENAFFATALCEVFRRVSRTDDIQIATVSNGRSLTQLADTVGMFVQTLPLVSRKSQGTAAEAIRAMQLEIAATLRNDRYPFTKLVERRGLRPNVIYAYQGDVLDSTSLSGLPVKTLSQDTAKVPISLNVIPQGDSYELVFEYDAGLYGETEISTLAKSLVDLSDSLSELPSEAPLAQASMVDEASAEALLALGTGAKSDYDRGETFVDLFLRRVQTNPSAMAVVAANGSLTYGELDAQSSALAAALVEKGVKPGDFVAVKLGRVKEFPLAVIAIWKAGAAYVPVDPEYPAERIAYMIADSEAKVVVDEAFVEKIGGEKRWRWTKDDQDSTVHLHLDSPPSLAYMIYTSGSTGKPKGVMVSHANLRAFLAWLPDELGLKPGEAVAEHASFSFDASICDLYTSLSRGATLHILSSELRKDLDGLAKYLADNKIVGASFSTQLGMALLNACELKLRYMVLGGEKLKHVKKTSVRLYNGYGPTEFTCWSSHHIVDQARDGEDIPIGRAVPNTLSAIVDKAGNLVPMGMVGELVLAGDQLTKGYWKRPELTAERFVEMPWLKKVGGESRSTAVGSFSDSGVCEVASTTKKDESSTVDLLSRPTFLSSNSTVHLHLDSPPSPDYQLPTTNYQLAYRTGDLARWNENGELMYCGRIDNQVKLRGFRIELGEIESAMAKFPGIAVAVADVKKVNGIERLVGYYVEEGRGERSRSTKEDQNSTVHLHLDSPPILDEVTLRAFLSQSLTEYMIPDAFVRLDSLPLTPNGKVDRKALPLPEIQGATYVVPEGTAEVAVAAAMTDVLNLKSPVGRDDDFLSLGGDSIKSIRLVSKLRGVGVTVTVADIMRAKTVKGVAACAKSETIFSADQSDWSGDVPLTAIQTAFLREWKLAKPAHFNQSQIVTASERLDADLLGTALDALARHHDMLRAVYDGDVQYVRAVEGEGPLCELTVVEGDDVDVVARESELVQASFDLEKGPLFKAVLFRGTTTDHVLLVAHHFVVDGVSWRILLEDLETAYGQLKSGASVKLPAKTMSFRDWREAVGRYAASYALRRELDYWRTVDAKVAELPHTEKRGGTVLNVDRTLASEAFAALTGKSAAAYRTEVNDLLLTALGRAYVTVTGERALSVELEGHGREPLHEETQIDRTVGWFTSAYPLVVETTDDVRTSIRRVKETLRRVPNHGLGYGILRYVAKDLFADAEPIPAVSFNYLGTFGEGGEKGLFSLDATLPQGCTVSAENVFGAALAVNCWGTSAGKLRIVFTYDPTVWEGTRATAFADAFIRELEAVVAHALAVKTPERTASDLGETIWSDTEFLNVEHEFSARGETLERIYPLTPMQEGMLLESLSKPDVLTYHITMRVALDVLPSEAQISSALGKLLAKHEVLRTAIVHADVCEPRQALVSGRKTPVVFVDLTRERDPKAAAAALERTEFDRSIDLTRDPLFRLVVAKTGDGSCQIVFAMHHIIADGWCIGIWLGDFKAFLSEAIAGRSRTVDFSSRNGRYERHVRDLVSRDREAAEAYWRGLLADYETKAEVPVCEKVTDANRAAENVVKFALSAERTARLAEVCRAVGCTMNHAIEAAWGLLLQKLNRTNDAVFVKVVSGRDHAKEDVSDLVGLFINSVPARVRTDKGATLRDLLRARQAEAAATSAHDWMPLSGIQRETSLGQDLFQSIVAFENYEKEETAKASDGFSVRVVSTHETNVSEIALTAYMGGESLGLAIDFAIEKYPQIDIDRLKDAFLAVLGAFVERPEAKASEVSLVDEDAAAALIALGTGERLDYDRSETLVDLFRRNAKAHHDSLAVVAANGTLTYSELDAQSDALAATLIEKGVKPDDFVVIKLGRVKEVPLAILGIWKAGAAYVPVDPEYPEERIRYMIADSGARVVVDEKEVKKLGEGEQTFTSRATPASLAYMIYTSGSTGLPKGVMVTHANILSFTEWLLKVTEAKPGEALAHFSSFSFDGSLDDLVTMFGSGATLHILDEATRRDMAAFHDYLVKNKIVVMDLPAAYAMSLLNTYDDIPLRFLSTGGEKLLATKYLPKRFVNGYGPTEFTVCSSIHDVDPEHDGDDIPIGRPVPNTLSAIVDADGNLLPRGAVGELVLAGDQLTRGYWKRPELTAEKFVEMTWTRLSQARHDGRDVSSSDVIGTIASTNRVYRTGDLARWNENGELMYCGRIDNQVKLRGFRIELGEIETSMAKFPGITAVVADVKKVNGIERLVGYYVGEEAKCQDEGEQRCASVKAKVEGEGEQRKGSDFVEVSPAEKNDLHCSPSPSTFASTLRSFLAQSLASYMIPDAFVRLDSLPMTPAGKVDRKALPLPEIVADEIVAPSTDRERQLFAVVADELKTEAFGVTTNLITMGLSSLRAIRLSAAIRQRTGIVVSTGDILAHPRIRDWGETDNSDVVIPVLPPREMYPLTPNQIGLYIDWERNPEGLDYTVPAVLKFTNVDAEKLREAVARAVAAHPYLKTHLENRNGTVVQVRRDDADFEIPLERLETAPDAAFFSARIHPFNLLKEDLARIEVFGYGKDAWLFYEIHHILYDGSSADVFVQTVLDALAGSALRAERVTGYDYALFLNDWMKSLAYGTMKQYYREMLAGTESFKYPARRERDPSAGQRAAGRTFRIARPEIKAYCRCQGITENAFFATTLCQVFHRVGRTHSVQIVTVSSGRSLAQLSDTVGMFVQTLPIVSKSPKGKATEILRTMQDQVAATLRNDRVSFAELSAEFHLEPEVMYVYQDGIEGGNAALPTGVEPVSGLTVNAIQRALTINVVPSDSDYEVQFDYDANIYAEDEMRVLELSVSAFARNLVSATEDCGMESIPLVSEREAQDLLTLGSGERLDYDRSETLVDLFRRNAKASPGSLAVVAANGTLTYSELDAQSDALAAALVEKGVKPNDFVVMKLGRVKEVSLAILGIWKAGAAYVPVDPEYPEERIAYMQEDSGARVVVDEKEVKKLGEGEQTFTSRATPASLAYMIYTSGSTGKPKGVMVSHANLRALTEWRLKETAAKPGECLAHFPSFSFDSSLDDLTVALGSGATLHILDEATRLDMAALHDYLLRNRIVVMEAPTAYATALLNVYDDIPLRIMCTGGEKLLPTKFVPKRFVNEYGPTEFTVCSSIHDVDPEHDGDDIPIGRPVPNTLSAIVDANGNLLPRGAVGELVLAGAQLTKGYWKRPELTAEKFVEMPWTRLSQARHDGRDVSSSDAIGTIASTNRVYRTGDLARWNENGELMYCGRIDNQVKLRGFRIELGEIETAMAKFPGITAAVADVKRVNGIERLVGYYVEEGRGERSRSTKEDQNSTVHLHLDSPPILDEVTLRAFLSQSLTEYMIPDAFVRLDSLPLTPNGKVDRKALPLPEIAAKEIVAPSTDRERQLFAVVADELKTEAFGVTTNLITMGLSSLRAIRLSAAIRQRTGIVVSTGQILSNPRIRDWSEAKESGVKVSVQSARETYPLTPNQLGLYIEWERNPGGLEYNVPAVLKFTNVAAEKLREAVAKAVSAHLYLKTHFENRNGTVVQVRRDEAEFAIPLERLESVPDAAFFSARIRPFDLLKDDLARIEVFGCGSDSWLFYEIHHILYDGSSADVFVQAVLDALAGSAPQSEQATALDYALFLENWKKSEAHDESVRHYGELLEGTESFKYPPRRGDAEASGTGASRIFRIARPAIKARCRELGITENAFFATVFSQVFHRAARTDRVQIATVSSGRSPEQLANTVGMFVQTLPLVSKSPKGKAAEILRTMQNQIAAILQNDLVSFAELAEKFNLSADVMYVYQDGVEGSMEGLPDCVRPVEGLTLTATQRGMTVGVSPASAGEYEIHIDYDGGLYAEDEMCALEHAVAAFAQNLAAASDADEISAIPLVTEAEARDLVALGTGEMLEYNADETFLDLFRHQAKEHSEATAVIASNGTFTYGELDAASDALAAVLVGKGVKPGDFVAVKLPRVREFPAAVIAAWKVGAAYVPVDPAAAPDRVAYMLEDSGARVVVDEAFVEKIGGEKRWRWTKDDQNSTVHLHLDSPPSLAYMIYTSGSTGKPKGVMVSHRALRAFIAWRSRLTGSTVGDCDGINASFSFDASMDIYATLASGATAYIFDDILKPDLDRILAQIRKYGIRVMGMNTSLGVAFLDNYDVPLNLLTLGGEALTPFRPCRTRVANCYGPTEFTVASVIGIVDQTFPDGTNISIGRPVPNSVCAIVDVYGNLLPRGMAGELCSAGVQIAEGYWGRPELTQEKFVSIPAGWRWKVEGGTLEGKIPLFNLQPSTFNLMYRTGDLVCWNSRGEVLYLGRMDAQVKFRGYRIELGEIESNVLAFPGIREAAVCVKKVGAADRLCAYYVSTLPVDEIALRAALAKSLADYMVPDCFIRLDAIPRNLSGKVDHKALPAPVVEKGEIVPPETDFEKKVFDVVAAELDDTDFGVTTNLIMLGLTSIRALRLSSAIRKATGREIRIGDILTRPRIRDWDAVRSESETIAVLPPRETYPLLPNQLELFRAWQSRPTRLQWNLPTALRLDGVDAEKLCDAVAKTIAAHPYLKVHLEERDGEAVQVRRDAAELPVLFRRLDAAPDAAFFQSRVRPFDLLHEDLARFEVYGFGADAYLFYDVHHIIFDGGSVGVFQSDLFRAYAGEEIQSEAVTAYDYALAYANWLKGTAHDEAGRYFEALVGDTKAFCLPSAARAGRESYRVGRHLAELPRAAIVAWCRARGVTENAFFATAYCEALRRTAGVDDVQIAMISNGRSLAQQEGMVGMFVETLPLVSRRPDGSAEETVHAMQRQIAEGVRRDRYPYAELAAQHGVKANVNYAYQGGLLDFAQSGPKVTNIPLRLDMVKNPLSLDVFPTADSYALYFEYDAGLYAEDEIRRLAQTLTEVARV